MVKLRRGFKTWCENASRGFRRELAIGAFDPLDPFALARHLGVTVWVPTNVPELGQADLRRLTIDESECWSALTIQDGGYYLIIINDSHPPTRIKNSLAHELSHVILRHEPPQMIHSSDGKMIMTDYDPHQEEEANVLGGALLVPREALLNQITAGATDEAAARFFGVSLQLLHQRKHTTGIGVQLARRGTWRP